MVNVINKSFRKQLTELANMIIRAQCHRVHVEWALEFARSRYVPEGECLTRLAIASAYTIKVRNPDKKYAEKKEMERKKLAAFYENLNKRYNYERDLSNMGTASAE